MATFTFAMFGSIVLDVVVGLVFIFLLYSILATIIAEIVSNLLRLRARTLEQAIYRMLAPEPTTFWGMCAYRFKAIQRVFLRSLSFFLPPTNTGGIRFEKHLKDRDFRDAFYNTDIIRFLGKSKLSSKPSYLKAGTFSKTVLDLLRKAASTKEPQTSELEKIKSALGKTTPGVMTDALKTHLSSLLTEADSDIKKFRGLLEGWYNETMDRCSGWYKRQIQIVLLVIGICLAMVFNVDTIQIVKKLSKDKEARQQMVALSTSFIEHNPELLSAYASAPHESASDSGQARTPDSVLMAKIDTLLKARRELMNDISEANSIIALGWQIPDYIALLDEKTKKCFSYEADSKVEKKCRTKTEFLLCVRIFLARNAMPPEIRRGNEESRKKYYASKQLARVKVKNKYYIIRKLTKWEKINYVLDTTSRRNWLGFLLTGLAISLGAPFWFDILNKLMKLRGSGRNSGDEKEEAKPEAKPAVSGTATA